MPRKVFGNKKNFGGPWNTKKFIFSKNEHLEWFPQWPWSLEWVIKVQMSWNQDLHQETMPQKQSFGIFEIHHLKMPSYLNKDLDCCYQCCIEYWNIFENFLPNIDIHIRFIAISLCLGLIKKGWSQNLHRYGIAILLYLVLLGCKKLITRHSHTWFCDESKIMGHKTSQKA